MEYDPNNNLNTPYIYNFEKKLWIRYYPKILDMKILKKNDFIQKKYTLYNTGVFLKEYNEPPADNLIYLAFNQKKNQELSFTDFKKYCQYILNDFEDCIPVYPHYSYIQNKKIYVKNCSFSKTPYNLDNLKNNFYIKSNDIEIIEVGEREVPLI